MLESCYTDCAAAESAVTRKPFIGKHKAERHDYVGRECTVHKGSPLAKSIVGQIYSVLSGRLSAAELWGWVSSNPARSLAVPTEATRVRSPKLS
jgi:hypothetical protein